jgi:hypothetical protein
MCDDKRKFLDRLLKKAGISIGTQKYIDFNTFIMNPANSHYLQLFYILCSGHLDYPDINKRTRDMIQELDFQKNNYSYSQLFQIHGKWYEFFSENAYPTGQRKSKTDHRRGVDKKYVDDIMNICKHTGLSLDDSIHILIRQKIETL